MGAGHEPEHGRDAWEGGRGGQGLLILDAGRRAVSWDPGVETLLSEAELELPSGGAPLAWCEDNPSLRGLLDPASGTGGQVQLGGAGKSLLIEVSSLTARAGQPLFLLGVSALRQAPDIWLDHGLARRLLDQAPALVAVHMGPEHVYVYSNPAHDRAVGARPLLGLPLKDAMPELSGQGIFERFDRVYRSGAAETPPVFRAVFDRDGSGQLTEGYYRQVLQPFSGEEGRVAGVMSFAFEVTEQIRAREAMEQLAARLRESEQHYRVFFEFVPAGVARADAASGRLLEVNDQFVEMLRRPREELLGMPFYELTYPEDRKPNIEGFYRALNEGNPTYTVEKRYLRGDGSPLWVHVDATIIRADPPYTIAVILDISGRKAAEAERERLLGEATRALEDAAAARADLQRILDSSTEYSIIAEDLDRRIVSWNEGARRLYGYTAEEIAGAPSSIIHAPDDLQPEGSGRLAREALENGTAAGQVRQLRKDGVEFTASVVITRRDDVEGRPIGYLLISRDITEDLERQRLAERSRELEAENRMMREASRLKSEFVANMSHELRTPLNSIIGFSELLLSKKVGELAPQHLEFLEDIAASAHHLLQIVNDVLDLSKIEAGRLEFNPRRLRLEDAVGEVLNVLTPLAAQKQLTVQTQISPGLKTLELDPTRLKQILYNLLSNAVKFTPEGGHIDVRGTPVAQERFQIEIQDTGIGIAQEDLPKLWAEFEQIDSGMAKKQQGTGLGLPLTRRIIEAQGGEIHVESHPGEGSCFTITLPRCFPSERAVSSPPPREDARQRVLIVEPDDGERALYERILHGAGYRVDGVADAGQALSLLGSHVFDGIVVDAGLPEADAEKIATALERPTGDGETSLILVGTSRSETGGGAHMQRINAVVPKPVAPRQLTWALEGVGLFPRSGRRVLVVDDDLRSLRLLELYLSQRGYQAICVNDAESALAAARSRPPDAIILDLLMPGMSGFSFLSAFRQSEQGRAVPVIVWTIKDLTQEEQEWLSQRAQMVVLKAHKDAKAITERLCSVLLPDEEESHAR